jgi:hypothetical protein
LDAAEQDRERYLKELNAYKQTEAYRIFTQKQQEQKQRLNEVAKATSGTIPAEEVNIRAWNGLRCIGLHCKLIGLRN